MEKKAKQNENNTKNSFGIAVLKRSGEINQAVWKWKQNNEYVTEIFKELIASLQADYGVSNTFIKNIQEEFYKLTDEKNKLLVEKDLIQIELHRLLKRAKHKKMKDSNFESLKNKLNLLLETDNIENFFMALNIADFIQRNTKQK
ncbi:MAG: hypothetical protein L3J56_00425 [Bacteroidales bacterium]|nr:hypothetical protein [Bacteroidales bacterium]